MAGNMSGRHKSPHRGSSVEFAQYRKYAPGDDIRLLDWRVYARTDRFYLKEFEADTNLRAYFVLDCSASMGFAGAPVGFAGAPGGFAGAAGSKLDFARRMIATLAYLLVQQGDAVGLSCFAEDPLAEIPARRNAAHLGNLFEGLGAVAPKGKTGLVPALHKLAEKAPRRSLVLLFSDCFTAVEPLLQCFQHLRFRKHDLAVFHVLARAELEFEFTRPTRFIDLETPFTLLAEPETIRNRYFAELHRFLDRLKTGCREFKTEYRQVVTDGNYEKIIADFLVQRTRKR